MSTFLPQVSPGAQANFLPLARAVPGIFLFMDLATKIRRARMTAGLTQMTLADAVGVSPGLVGAWETGRKSPGREVLKRLCDTLGVSADSLLDESAPLTFRITVTDPLEVRILTRVRALPRRQRENFAEILGVAQDVAREMEPEHQPADG